MHGQTYQALSARAAAFHERFVQALATGGAPMRPPRPPASRRCRARSIC
ncbi:PE-PGRS family protein [Mycobacterium tuberculosis GM 1503]|nr:PE family protein [Mycobacterium tuberculosis]EFD75351.1 PE-PGRS family protein [Mycobacterium tuberculosis GM 1503]